MIVALLAALAMVCQDILGVLLVQAEARNRGLLAGVFDALGWLATITTTSISVSTLQGHNLTEQVLVITLVTAANIGGSVLGVKIGKKIIKEVI